MTKAEGRGAGSAIWSGSGALTTDMCKSLRGVKQPQWVGPASAAWAGDEATGVLSTSALDRSVFDGVARLSVGTSSTISYRRHAV